jgi:DNA-binding CsgD family transcriptional regulator
MKILGAVYDVGQPRESWLRRIMRALLSAWAPGAGVGGVLYDISDGMHVRTEFLDGIDVADGWREVGIESHRDVRLAPWIIKGYRSHLCATLPELSTDSQVIRSYRRAYYDRHGVTGQILVNGADCSGRGCALYLFSLTPLTLSAAERDLLERLATHLSTAHRLQRQLAGVCPGAGAGSAGVEAVLTPAGDVDHADAGARSANARQVLRLAVRQRERARSFAGRDAERVVRSLKGLVDARWTLIDHYESGGKRYVLARENAPKPLGPPRLSQRERQVLALAALGRTNKLIAYELGLAHSTVRVLMSRASVKLGASTRPELISRHGAIGSR